MKRKHVLQVNIDNNGGNGAFSLMTYVYEYMSDEYIFDYYTMGQFVHDAVYENIISNEGHCYSANLRKNKIFGHIRLPFRFYAFLKKHDYDIVHIHSEVAYKHYLYAIAAKKANIQNIVIHSQSNSVDGNCKLIKKIFHKLCKSKINKIGTTFLACSEQAAEWMFESYNLKSNKYHLLSNGIAPDKYKFSSEIREKIRKELNIENCVVIGHVGALKWVKNQKFLIEILQKLNDKNYKLILVGDGDDKEELIELAKHKNCIDNVLFLGSRCDVNELLQAMDIFIFPSIFEGVPVALIEAQAVGLPIIASDTINHNVKINDNLYFYSLNEKVEKWILKIEELLGKHLTENGYMNVINSDYNIENSANELKKIYD